MIRLYTRFYLLLAILLVSIPLSGNTEMKPASFQDSVAKDISFIPVVNISSEAASISSEILSKRLNLLGSAKRASIKASTDTLLFRLRLLREDPAIQDINNLSFRSMAKIEGEWNALKSRLLIKEGELKSELVGLQSNIVELRKMTAVWQATLSNAREEAASDKLIKQVETVIDSLEYSRYLFREDSDYIQERMVQISNSLIFCNRILSEIGIANDVTGSHILKLTQPPVWKALNNVRNDTLLLAPDRAVADDIIFDLKEFGSDESFRIVLHVIIFGILLFVITRLFRNLRTSVSKDTKNATDAIKSITKRPLSATFLLTFLASYFIYTSLPNSIIYINLLLLFVPVMLIIYDIMPEKVRKYILLPSIAVMLATAHSYSYSDSLFSRLFLMLIDVFSIISVIFAIRKRTFRDNAPTKRMGMVLYYLALNGIFLMGISLLGVVFGAGRLAEFITYATLRSVALVFIIYALNKTVDSLLYTLIFGSLSANLKILSQYTGLIFAKLTKFTSILSWILWIILSLKQFYLWSNIRSVISAIFGNSINIGTSQFTLANIIVFFLVIWFTLWLSRVIKILVEGEIAPRVKMKRGVPGAVTLILRIVIITAGFLFAVAAAGIEVDKLSILLGALGVGIGFGLQNIFNNLVSGIILAFERPIQEGDIIEVGTLLGTVKEIGIRASVIFTFDGAEVIVPNGNLISNELINWTLTNMTRRVEAKVGVKYGTNPDSVLDILRNVAAGDPEILKEPAPLALFSGFGESSLDFRLLFWIDNADRRWVIHSKVNVAINRGLAEAGIEIPFPQRDLHLRSISKDISIKLP